MGLSEKAREYLDNKRKAFEWEEEGGAVRKLES
jgi:hypothetical protein